MVNKNHLKILEKGVDVWNKWREENPSISPNLSQADLSKTNLNGVDLSQVDLSKAKLNESNLNKANLYKANLNGSDLTKASLHDANLNEAKINGASLFRTELYATTLHKADLSGSNLWQAEFSEADLPGANLTEAFLIQATLEESNLTDAVLLKALLRQANLVGADFTGANLSEADLSRSDLSQAKFVKANLSLTKLIEVDLSGVDFTGANLSGADLSQAKMINVILNGANLSDCRIFGISAWKILGAEEAEQSNLIITPEDESIITVDDLEIAQFIYLLLKNQKIRSVIDTITSKVVLILGRFTAERKVILDAIRDELRKRNYLPVLFDFNKPSSRGITETVSTLAHMARFVIADITDARSIPQELMAIVPNLPSVPVQPIILSSAKEYAMVNYFKNYHWFLKIHLYNDMEHLLSTLKEKVIIPAENKAKKLQKT